MPNILALNVMMTRSELLGGIEVFLLSLLAAGLIGGGEKIKDGYDAYKYKVSGEEEKALKSIHKNHTIRKSCRNGLMSTTRNINQTNGGNKSAEQKREDKTVCNTEACRTSVINSINNFRVDYRRRNGSFDAYTNIIIYHIHKETCNHKYILF